MDINYFMKVQNAYKTTNKREKNLNMLNHEMLKHFEDTIDTDDVLINGSPSKLMIIKDTDGNAFKKKIKSWHDNVFNLGDYVIWNNQYWLIMLIDPDNKTWNRGYMFLCTVPLRWQHTDGKIIERWAYEEDLTKYSSGTTGNNLMQIGDNQYSLALPLDSDTIKLKRDLRFAIDLDNADEPDIYKLTNKKANLNNSQYFNRGGIMKLTMSFDAFDIDKDKYIKINDNKRVWICDYHSPISSSTPSVPSETTVLSASISGSESLRIRREQLWSVSFVDKDGIQVENSDFSWSIVSSFNLEQVINGNTIKLKVDDDSLIGESFLLSVLSNDNVIAERKVMISGVF